MKVAPPLAKDPVAPRARREPVRRTVHGVELVDDYDWIRAANWQEVLKKPKALPADIRELVLAEKKYAADVLAPTKTLQRQLVKEMRARIKEDDSDVPMEDGPFSYYERYREGGEHEIVCRRPRGGGEELILVDGDSLAKGKAFFELGEAAHAPDHMKLAWSVDEQGSEYHTIRVRDLSTGADLDTIADTEGGAVWTADSRAFYYVRLDDNHRPNRVFLHVLGTASETDRLVYEENDPAWFVSLGQTQSRAFAVIDVNDHDSSEIRLLDLSTHDAEPLLIEPRRRGVRYSVEHHGDRLFILTNDEAEDFRIAVALLATPARANWRDFVAHRSGRLIVDQVVFGDHHVRLEREEGLPRLVVHALASGEEHVIAFAEEAYSLWLEAILEFDTTTMRFGYSSMTTPKEIYDYDMATRTRVLRKRQEIPSGHDPEAYVTRRVFATAPDGEKVPVSLLYAKTTKLDGSAPLFIQGYGAYGHAMSAGFRANPLSLVDRGFVYATAHIRGGTDKGWRWYTNGKLEHKTNTFTDFIAAVRHLCQENYTSEGRVVAMGGSAGGLLMGAIANMAPQLFAGIIADVPFVDVLNTILDATLPLTPPEWLEWGDPIKDPQAFARIRSYSPYDNVTAQRYPAILAFAGLTDPRVTYWEPTKWVAKLRATMTGGGPILLDTNMDAGHGGASGRFERLDEVATGYAFAMACVAEGEG